MAVVGIWDLKGDFETRLFFVTCLKLEDVRRATSAWGGLRRGESRLEMRKGETGLALPLILVECWSDQPMPESRSIWFFTGSGELDSSRSRSGDAACRGEVMVVDVDRIQISDNNASPPSRGARSSFPRFNFKWFKARAGEGCGQKVGGF